MEIDDDDENKDDYDNEDSENFNSCSIRMTMR